MCRTLGNGRWRHPDEMLADMSHAQFEDWVTVYGLSPWGEERDDLRMARIAWAVLQPHSKRKVDESRLRFRFGRRQVPTPEQHRRNAMRAYAAIGAQFDRAERKA